MDIHPSGSLQPHDERTEVENLLYEFQGNPGVPSPAQVHSLIDFWPLATFRSILNHLKKKKTVRSGVRNQNEKIVILSRKKIIQALYSGHLYSGIFYFKAKKQLLACEW